MRTIQYSDGKARVELVTGLTWEPLKGSNSEQTKQIKTFKEKSNFDLKVLRGSSQPHVGLAKKSSGQKKGQISAAAMIADKVSGFGAVPDFLAAVKVPDEQDLYIFVAVNGNTILIDGDLSGTQEVIKAKLAEFAAFGGWTVVCPAEWGFSNSTELAFRDIFNEPSLRANRKYALADVSIAWRGSVIPGLLVVAVGFGGFSGWTVWQKKRAAEAMAMRLHAEEVARGKRLAVAEPPKPWPAMPDVVPFAAACNRALDAVGLTAGNWKLNSITCTPRSLAVSWSKPDESAWISHLRQVRPSASFTSDGMTATVVEPVDVNPSNAFTEALPPKDGVNLRYFDLASRYGMSIRIDPVAAPAAKPLPGRSGVSAPPEALPSWDSLSVQVQTRIDAADAAAILAYPGLRFNKITYTLSSGVMQIQLSGVQYVLR